MSEKTGVRRKRQIKEYIDRWIRKWGRYKQGKEVKSGLKDELWVDELGEEKGGCRVCYAGKGERTDGWVK
jgi:hypothetical protein